MKTPVLLLLFNRPDLADRVFSCVREARPDQVFIAVDGPRDGNEEEKRLVEENQAFTEKVDWPCQIHTLFREKNLGCGRAVSEAISWFFSNVESGIILEDDCVPDPSFFQFASELLHRYADDDRVMMINGATYQEHPEHSYYFSKFDQVWGWASWRRAWATYDFKMSSWPGNATVKRRLKELRPLTQRNFTRAWARIQAGEVDTWDYQWGYAIWANDGVIVTPSRNLISNIGFDKRATHTNTGDDGRAERVLEPLEFPLRHPEKVEIDSVLDRRYETSKIVSIPFLARRVWNRITSKWL